MTWPSHLLARKLASMGGSFPAEVWKLSVVAFTAYLGYLILPLVALYLRTIRDFPIETVGQALAASGLGAIVGAWAGGQLADRLGARRTLFVSLFGAALAAVALSAAWSPPLLALLLFTLSAFRAAFRPAYNTLLIDLCGAEERQRAYSLYLVAVNLGGAIGISVAGVAFAFAPRAIFFLEAACSILAAAAMALLLDRTERAPGRYGEEAAVRSAVGPSPWRDVPFAALCGVVLLVEVVGIQHYTTLPVFLAEHRTFSSSEVSWLLALGNLLFAALAVPFATWSRGYARQRLAAWGALAACLSLAVLPLARTIPAIVALFTLGVLGSLLFFLAVVDVVMSMAEQGRRGSYMGLYHGGQAVSAILAPPLGTFVYARWGPTILWLACGTIGAVAFLFFLSLSALKAPRAAT